MSYAVPQVDWSPLGNLLNTYQDARRKAERERVLREAGQSPDLNLSQLGQRLLGTGDLDAGVSLYRLGQQQRQLDAQTAASRDFMRMFGNEPSAPTPQAPANTSGIPPGLIRSESGGNFRAQNDAMGAGGQRGHFGRLQFGQARLQEAAAAGAIPQGTTPEAFMASPEMQQAAERWHFGDIDAKIQQNGLGRFVGQTINGTPVTLDGMRAVAHLGGSEGLRRFLVSGGQYNPQDRNGTRLSDYLARMGGGGAAPQAAPVQVASAPTGTAADAPMTTGALPPVAAAPAATPTPAPAQQAPTARVTTGEQVPLAAGPLDRLSVGQLVAASSNPSLSEGLRQTAQTLLKSKLEATNLTPDQRNYMMARGQGETRSFSDWMVAMRQAGATRVNQNNVNTAERTYDQEIAKQNAARLGELNTASRSAQNTLNTLNVMERLTRDPNFYSGFGAERATQMKRLLSSLGITDAAAASPNETFQSLSNKVVLDGLGGSLGTAISNADRDFIQQTAPNLNNTPEGNRRIIEMGRALAQRQQEVARMAREYARKNGGRLDGGFDDELQRWAEANPLRINRDPVQGAAPPATGGRGPVRVTSPEEASRLPKGTQFLDPNGVLRVVP